MSAAVRLADPPAPGTLDWLRYMTGSKIAAVMRLSPYESAYSLWHRMAGVVGGQPETDVMRRGHYLEPGIIAWLADRHPELTIGGRGSMWASLEHPDYAISPDALGTDLDTGETVVLEAKAALDKDVWGEQLSDEIPVCYRCQVMWAMGLLGARRALVGVLTSHLEFREYEVRFDQVEFDLLTAEAAKFMTSLVEHRPPDIDSHSATYEAIKQMHPMIDGAMVEVAADIAVPYTRAKVAEKAAADDARLWTAHLAHHMGNAKTARFNGQTIATRRAQCGGVVPHVRAVNNLEPLPLELLHTTDLEGAN